MMNGHYQPYLEHSSLAVSHKKVLLNKDLSSQILRQLNEYRLERVLTDAVLSVDQEELHCHRCVLAASSPYFQATFSSPFKESINAHISLQDISPWIMKRILDYIYSGSLEISLDTALDYLKTGHILQYPAIVEASCELLQQHLDPINCIGVKELAALYHCDHLEASAYNFALEHFAAVVERSEELSELSFDSFVRYLSSDNVDISSEIIMWRAIHNWIHADVDRRRTYLYDLLSCMRLPYLTSKEVGLIRGDTLVRSQPKCLELLDEVCGKDDRIDPDILMSTENLKVHGYQRGARPSTLPRDVVVLFGGSSNYELTRMLAYDPLKDRWISLPAPPENIIKGSITSYGDTIFITGGIVNNELSNTMWIFCCKEKRWIRGESLMEARAKHSSAAMNGILYMSGGIHRDENQTVTHMTEIHSYDIESGVWRHVGASSNGAKLGGTLLAFDDVLYELGGLSDEVYSLCLDIYKITSDGLVTCTESHFVLPCIGEPGPLQAVLDEKDRIIILWENTGALFALDTNSRRFNRIEHSLPHLSGCLVALNHRGYILGGLDGDRPGTMGNVLDISNSKGLSYDDITLPADLFVHKCVRVKM